MGDREDVHFAAAAANANPTTAAAIGAGTAVADYERKHWRGQVLAAFAVLLVLIGVVTYIAQHINSHEWGLLIPFEAGLTDWSVAEPLGSNAAGYNWNTGEIIFLVSGGGLILLALIVGGFTGVFWGAIGALFIANAFVRYLTGAAIPRGLPMLAGVDWKGAFGLT